MTVYNTLLAFLDRLPIIGEFIDSPDELQKALRGSASDPLSAALSPEQQAMQRGLSKQQSQDIALTGYRPSELDIRERMKTMRENQDFFQKIKTNLAEEEGIRDFVYKDSKGKWTTGIGHLIGDGSLESLDNSPFRNVERRNSGSLKSDVIQEGRRLNDNEINMLFEVDVDRIYDKAKDLTPNWRGLSDNAKAAIISATYRGDWGVSPKTRKLFSEGKFDQASDEFLNNDDYRESKKRNTGVYRRMERIAKALKEEQNYG
jgi:GH24 family phage-related lysozyme (muramidase)